MDQQLADLSGKLIQDAKYFSALAGFIGVLCGSIITLLGNLMLHVIKEHKQSKIEKSQKRILLEMLKDGRFPDKWRNIDTLCSVIGETELRTKQLLIQIEARGSESDDKLWGLIEYHPLTEVRI